MDAPTRGDWTVLAVLVGLALVFVVLIVRRMRGARPAPSGAEPEPTQYAANPDPSRITDAMWWLWQQLLALEPSSKLGGIYANKPGYHNARNNLSDWDYSVCDNPPDQGGPGDKAAAIDWTFPDAQSGNYSTISTYTKRLIDSGKDPDDPRLDGWREVYGNADNDTYVEGWDFRYGYAVTSDSSHLWHIHASENRDQTTSQKNKEAFLSVVKGETVAQWLGGVGGEGSVLLNCPYDKARQDLFYVGPTGEVYHRWFTGGMNTLWTGGGSSEKLGGKLAAGTLAAVWRSDQGSIDIAGLGTQDGAGPVGAGQYWGMNLARSGTRSGWGTFEKCYGAFPGVATVPPPANAEGTDRQARIIALVAFLVALVAIIAAASASWR